MNAHLIVSPLKVINIFGQRFKTHLLYSLSHESSIYFLLSYTLNVYLNEVCVIHKMIKVSKFRTMLSKKCWRSHKPRMYVPRWLNSWGWPNNWGKFSGLNFSFPKLMIYDRGLTVWSINVQLMYDIPVHVCVQIVVIYKRTCETLSDGIAIFYKRWWSQQIASIRKQVNQLERPTSTATEVAHNNGLKSSF